MSWKSLSLSIACVGALLVATPGMAGTVNVTTATDGVAGSLRDAFDIANSDGVDTTIILAAGETYALTVCGVDDTNVAGDLDHTEDNLLEIVGNGSTIDGSSCPSRVIDAHVETAVLTLEDLTITGGAGEGGFLTGGVRSLGLVNVFDSVITDNEDGGMEIGDVDGLIFSPLLNMQDSEVSLNGMFGLDVGEGDSLIEDSRIVDNLGDGFKPNLGGTHVMNRTLVRGNMEDGVGGTDALLTITDSVIHDNGDVGVRTTSPGFLGLVATIERTAIFDNAGHGVNCADCDPLNIINSTISNNGVGVMARINTIVNLDHATIVNNGDNFINEVPFDPRGGVLNMFASVIGLVDAGGSDCTLNGPPVVSNGYNFDGDGSCGLGAGPGDQPAGGDPLLRPLEFHSGPSPSPGHLPKAGSPLLDTVPPASCVLPIDQRGLGRPADFGCETGAIERLIPLYVMLDSFTADVTRRGVVIRWTTSAEIDNVGFRVLRETEGSRHKAPVAIEPTFIHGQGSAFQGAEYKVVDPSRPGEHIVRYYLEDIDAWGVRTRHGPITVGSGGRRGRISSYRD